MTELEALRKRVKHQRRELRILNKQLRAFWRGWYFRDGVGRLNDFRGRMIKAFGFEAIEKAEKSK